MHADRVRIRQPVTLRRFHRFKEDSAVAGEGTQEQSNRRGKSHLNHKHTHQSDHLTPVQHKTWMSPHISIVFYILYSLSIDCYM